MEQAPLTNEDTESDIFDFGLDVLRFQEGPSATETPSNEQSWWLSPDIDDFGLEILRKEALESGAIGRSEAASLDGTLLSQLSEWDS